MAAKRKNRKQNQTAGIQKPGWLQLLFVSFFIVLLPLIYSKATIEPATFPRFLAISIGLLFFAAVFIIRNKMKSYNIFKQRPLIFLFGFILISVVSLFFAINPVEGLADILKWSLVFLFIWFFILTWNENTGFMELITKAVLVSAAFAILLGFYQFFTEAFQNDDPNALYEVSGLMAHKNQFSISLFLMLPFVLFGAVQFRSLWRNVSWIVVSGIILLIAILQTRAVWIAMPVAFLIGIAGWLYMKNQMTEKSVLKKLSGKILIVGVAVIVVGGMASFLFSGKSPAQRISSIFDSRNTSNEWRIEMWVATVDLIKDHPVTGVGAGNWKIAVYPYYGKFQPSVYRHWRNSHNDYLQVTAEKGFVGLFLFILFYFSLIVAGFQVFYKSQNKQERLIALFLTATFIGFMIISVFSFPTERINHLVYMGIFAGIIISLKTKKSEAKESHARLIILPAIAVLAFAIYFGISSVRSEIYISKAQALKDSNDKTAFAAAARKGNLPLVPFEPRYSFPVVNYAGLADFVADGNYENALEKFKKAFRQNPTNFAVINNVGSVYGQMGQYDSSIVYYQKTLDIFNHYDQGLLNMAKAWYLKGDYKKAYFYILCCDPKSRVEDIPAFKRQIEQKLN